MEKEKQSKILKLAIALCLVAAGIAYRLLPHPANFSPVAAIALFSGAYFSKKYAFIIPLAAMLVSDFFIGFYDLKLMGAVYASFAMCILLGMILKNKNSWVKTGSCAVAGSLAFFVITNFAVFAFYNWYPKTLQGLWSCYFMALPFLRNSVVSDLLFAGIFFGAYGLASALVDKKILNKNINIGKII